MLFNYILLHVTSFMDDLPVSLLLCIVPFILGWLFAYLFHKVSSLNGQINQLTADNTSLNAKVNELTNENTELRVKLTQLEAELEKCQDQVRKAKNDLILCDSERLALKEQLGGAAAPKAAAKAPAAKTVTFNGTKYKWDDLKIVEGIGPKIAELLNDAGITTWEQLAVASPYRLREILDAGGSQFNIHDPESWPNQADLAAHEKWDELKKLQETLDGGKAS